MAVAAWLLVILLTTQTAAGRDLTSYRDFKDARHSLTSKLDDRRSYEG